MKRPLVYLLVVACFLAACDATDSARDGADFTYLARAADGYAAARPGRPLAFPRDHGAHPDFRIEWWYLTANLAGDDGADYGAQWTLFRTAVRPPGEPRPDNPWQDGQVYMAHFALSGPNGHRAFQRYARGGSHGGEARSGAVAEPFAAWLDDWELASTGPDWLPLEVRAAQDGHALHLVLDSDQSLVLQGENGFSQKHPGGGGSHYYSQPFLRAEGELALDGRRVVVRGKAWLDREWSSQFLQPNQAGWDWFALHLDNGEKLMLFRLRGAEGPGNAGESYRHGVLIAPDGSTRQLAPDRIEMQETNFEEVAGRRLPLSWRIGLPEIGRRLTITTPVPEQWMDVDFPYWEGMVTASGDGPGSRGVGYLELTGYAKHP